MSIQHTITSITILGPLFILFLLALVVWTRVSKIRYTARQHAFILAFAIYILGVMHFVFFPIDINIGMYANQTPWYKTIQWVPLLTADVPSFVLNILLFMPLGFMLPMLKPSVASVRKAASTGLIFSFLIEMLQLLIRITLGNGRSTDVNDLIANMLGSVIGFLILKWFANKAIGQRLLIPWKLPRSNLRKDMH